jgi:hypothetical protein
MAAERGRLADAALAESRERAVRALGLQEETVQLQREILAVLKEIAGRSS